MKLKLTLLLLAFMSFACSAPVKEEVQKPELRFKGGKLKIVQFTDVHWSDGESDARIPQIMGAVLDAENPDVIVFTGDVVTGGPVVENWTKFVEYMHGIGIPYAVVMGNHDPETHNVANIW